MTSTVSRWPALPLAEWAPTRDTLHLWTQIVGKVRLARTPTLSHWWNVPLYVTARGLTTSLIPANGRGFQIDFDLVDHQLRIAVSDGNETTMSLEARPVAEFYTEVMAKLDDLGLSTSIWTMPVEIPNAIPFEQDRVHASYERDQVERFWHALVEMNRVFEQFRSEFVGKTSPVHLFWGALDLAVTRFSGRAAPPHPGGAPNCGPHVMHEAYSHEVSSAGYWPGPDGEGVFYSYAYPEPDGYRQRSVTPAGARFDDGLSEFVLPYENVRTAPDPDAALLEFLRSTYVAAAETADWHRKELER
ncbi:MAG: DUF5996 family protein [Actinomycetota bacterium]|nr:DUF5996 family protein [Actinomycetota bacterium]